MEATQEITGEELNEQVEAGAENVETELQMEVYPKKAEKVGVYQSRFGGGGASTQVCEATVEYAGLTLAIVIWMRLSIDRNNGAETITVEPGLPTGIKIDDKAFLETFKDNILRAAEVWFGYKTAEEKATERLLNPAAAQATAGRRVSVVHRPKK